MAGLEGAQGTQGSQEQPGASEQLGVPWLELMGGEILIERTEGASSMIEMGTIVVCDLKGYLLRHDGGDMGLKGATRENKCVPFEILEQQQIQIGEGDCIPGLELALKYAVPNSPYIMRCSSKFGFGPGSQGTGMGVVGPDTMLEYEILVTRIKKEVDEDLPEGDGEDGGGFARQCWGAHADVVLRKECGNRWFSYKDYGRAARSYTKGLQKAESFFGSLEETDDATLESAPYRELVGARLACLTNLSACLIFLEQYGKAKEACVAVLEVDPGNKKALLRAARAATALCEYEEAQACLSRLLEIDPDNAAAQQELRRFRETVKKSRSKEQAFSKRMMGGADKDRDKDKDKDEGKDEVGDKEKEGGVASNSQHVEVKPQEKNLFLPLALAALVLVPLLSFVVWLFFWS